MFNESAILRGYLVNHRGFNDQLAEHLPALFNAFQRHGKLGLQYECSVIQRTFYVPVYALVSRSGACIMGQGEIITFSEV